MIALMTIHSLARRYSDEAGVVPSWTLGDRLRKSLEVSGLSVANMAETQGVGTATVSRWLHDRSPIRRGALTLWAIATGVDQAWLETGTAGLENQTGRDQYAIRDSNPEPADMEPRPLLTVLEGGNRGLPVDRIPAGWPIPEPPSVPEPRQSPDARRLWAVS